MFIINKHKRNESFSVLSSVATFILHYLHFSSYLISFVTCYNQNSAYRGFDRCDR